MCSTRKTSEQAGSAKKWPGEVAVDAEAAAEAAADAGAVGEVAPGAPVAAAAAGPGDVAASARSNFSTWTRVVMTESCVTPSALFAALPAGHTGRCADNGGTSN